MAVVRICMCPCGHFGVQEAEELPLCHVCGTDDVDWMNVDPEDLKMDLKHAAETLPNLSEKKEHEEAHPVD